MQNCMNVYNVQGSSRHSIFSKKRKCSNDNYRYVFETLEVNSIKLSHKSMVFALQTRQFSNPYTLKLLGREITFSWKSITPGLFRWIEITYFPIIKDRKQQSTVTNQ